MSGVGKAVAAVAAVLVIVGVVIVGGIALGIYGPRVTAEPIGKTEEIVQTNRGAYRIAAYGKFYRLEERVKGLDVQLSTYPPCDELDDRSTTEYRGILATRANLVAEYNAASDAERTQGKWRADDLPEQLENITEVC